ncbi:MAG TPA: hypothetical protein VGW39_02295 [Chthoniobacterales bacterium]|nr:hypothetical protein [Chthoniobacterales bacterium]
MPRETRASHLVDQRRGQAGAAATKRVTEAEVEALVGAFKCGCAKLASMG